MIKVTYETHDPQAQKPELTTVNIFEGKMFVRYNIPNKAESVVKQMREDGKTGVLYSRGAMIQIFSGKSEEEILEIVKEDIKNGIYVAEYKTKKKLEVKNMVIENNEK